MRIRLVLLLMLVAAAVCGWRAESHAGDSQRLLLRVLATRLQASGTLSYGDVEAHFWGAGTIKDLRFTPGEALRQRLNLPADWSLQIPRLGYRHWQPGTVWPAAVQLRFDEASWVMAAPWPQQGSGTLDWHYSAARQHVQLGFTLDAPDAAALKGELTLQLAQLDSLDGATLLGGTLHYRDQGLAQNQRALLAMRAGADPQDAATALANALSQWLSAQGLPPDAALQGSLQAFAQEPLAFTLHVDPPGQLRPQTLPQFAAADRIAALGLSLETAR